MQFDELVERLLKENWEKGTSKAPKYKSYDMSRGGAPSNVNAASDGQVVDIDVHVLQVHHLKKLMVRWKKSLKRMLKKLIRIV